MKIDLVLGDNKSLENIDNNKKVRRVKELVQKKLHCDVKEEDMFPIKNYVKEIEFDVDMDILLLSSLLHMLKCAQNYLENKEMWKYWVNTSIINGWSIRFAQQLWQA